MSANVIGLSAEFFIVMLVLSLFGPQMFCTFLCLLGFFAGSINLFHAADVGHAVIWLLILIGCTLWLYSLWSRR